MPCHERSFDDQQRPAVLLPGLLGVLVNVLDDALDQRVAQALLDRALAPFLFGDFDLVLLLDRLGEFDEALGGVRPAVEQHVLHQLQQVLRDLLIDRQHPGVHDAHVQPCPDGVIEKRRVHRLAHDVVAAEGEGNVADAAADAREGQVLLDPFRRADEVRGVVVVLLDAGGDRQDVRVEDDVLRREAGLLGQDAIRALADLDLALETVGLAALVERHHHHRRAVTADQLRLAHETSPRLP